MVLPPAVGRVGIAAALLVAVAALCWPAQQPHQLSQPSKGCPMVSIALSDTTARQSQPIRWSNSESERSTAQRSASTTVWQSL